MNITLAKWCKDTVTDENVSIKIIANGVVMHVPISVGNADYAEIMRQVEAGTLTIEEAE
tara:strand:- start:701 stop:877 length:177 start_codon:yes stop_codon:yes gene_type:complete